MIPRAWRCLFLLFLATPAAVAAQDAPAGWAWTVSPYLLSPHMNGSIGVGTVDAEVDASPSDIFDNLQFGAMVTVEARSPTWAVAFDGIYMDLGKDAESSETGVSLYQAALELTAFRRVGPWAEVLAGGRLNLLGAELEGPLGTVAETDESWLDPFVGVRLSAPFGEGWSATFRADIGGFGVGSDLAWQVHSTVEYRLSPSLGLTGGYRVLSSDYETGSGADRFAYDVRTFGPELGVVIHF